MIEVLVALGILAVVSSAFLSLMISQKQEVRIITEDMARLALEASVAKAMTSSGICSFLISDPSQSSTSAPPNRSVDVIDVTTDAILATQEISIRRIPAGASIAPVYLAEVNKVASPNSNGVVIESMKFNNFRRNGVDQYLADFRISFKPPPVAYRPVKQIIVKDLFFTGNSITPANAKAFTTCSAPKGESAQLQRIYFTAADTPVGGKEWTVPAGVRSALVTMSGGGASGYGWRVGNALKSGDSGGYLVSYPIALIPGETLTIYVGRGAPSYFPYTSSGISYAPTSGDDGYSGYPGTSSKIVRTSSSPPSTILECAGGGGAHPGPIDSLILDPYFNVPGALTTPPYQSAHVGSSGTGINPTERPAAAPYGSLNSPGRCGPAPAGVDALKFGRGYPGMVHFTGSATERLPAGTWPGGRTPTGGSGGEIYINGCNISSGAVASCVYPGRGEDGVVIFDMLY
ncbi:MAG: type II secretion system protein [Bdellovibrionaceae bacterium]|nr:type II secretion system protein [Pseudobdellovibrionaceae bacterium]